jgi:biotin carboxylase
MRKLFQARDVPSPKSELFHFSESDDLEFLNSLAQRTSYPCVVKPLHLNGSRGVIRADNQDQFAAAAQQLRHLLTTREPDQHEPAFLVEQYIPGIEVALEGLLSAGHLKVLALFDKPDPLEGPYFEETIYVTPSRLPVATQELIAVTTANAAAALGLREGPVHAELRLNNDGPFVIELAGRSIGGLCSKTLQFGVAVSLEEMIVRQAFGMEVANLERVPEARGVMMIPIPQAGILKAIKGCEAAESVQYIDSVEITAHINHRLVPLPEGESYLGFIFARGPSPDVVEEALRTSHEQLTFEILPELPLVNRDFAVTTA